jgi:catalase
VSYEPNSLATGSEFRVDGGQQGFQTREEALESPKQRRRSPSFDDHFSQATLFWNSQSPAEKEHIVSAFQYELSRVQVPAIRQRVVDNLAHVDARLARKVAEPLALAPPDPKAAAGRAGFRETKARLPIEASPSLSMEGSNGGITTRRVAVLAAAGVEIGALKIIQQALSEAGALCCVIADHLGVVSTSSGQQLPVDQSFMATSSVLFDAVLVPGGTSHVQALARNGNAVHFLLEAYRHCKPICLIGSATELLQAGGIVLSDKPPAGVLVSNGDPATRVPLAQEFVAAIARHRHWTRSPMESVPA